MSVLYDMRVIIDRKIDADKLDGTEVRGEIGMRSGRLVSLISAHTVDDPVAIAKLRNAIKEVLHIDY